ncbi:MAG: LamG-like jellyroll fold domain-containing protein [Saprospiraceae bacterium]
MGFKYNVLFSMFLLLTLSTLSAQNLIIFQPKPFVDGLPFTSVIVDEETPVWAVMMYGENPNMSNVESALSIWRRDNPHTKNGHTRNFKHYYRYLIANDGLNEDGTVVENLEEKIFNKKQAWNSKKAAILKNQKLHSSARVSNNNTDWESIGPTKMLQNGNLVDRQANMYSMTQCAANMDVLYAVSEAGATVFKSTDRGESWSSTNDNFSFSGNREIEVDPTNENIVFVTSHHNIYKSTDGGVTWTSTYYNWNTNPNAIIIDPTNTDKIIISCSERILRSTNGGTSWTQTYSGKTYDVKFKPGNSQIVYALMDNTTTKQTDFYKSTNNGINWSKITNGWPNETSTGNSGGRLTTSDGNPEFIYAFIGASYTAATVSKDGIKVMKSNDSGTNWETALNYTNTGGVNRGQGYYDWDIEMSDVDTNIVLLGTQGKWLTTDGFATTDWAHTGLGHADLQEVLFNGSDLWVVTDGGIIKFDDETFDTYQVKSTGINAVSYWSFDQGWNRDAQVGSHYHNGTSARTDTYVDGEYLSYGGAEPQFSALKHPTPDKAWSKGYGAVNGKSLPDDINAPIVSFDYNITPNAGYGSATWNESEIEVLPSAYNTHFTGAGNVLWRSDNFGLSWDTVAVFGNADSKVTKIEISRANLDVMYVAVYNSALGYKIYRSDNLGQVFTEISGPSGVSTSGIYLEVDQIDEDVLYFATSSGGSANNKVYKSLDAGQSWTNLSTNMLDGAALRAILNVAGTDGGVYVISSNAVFYRNNTMNDWDALLTNLPDSPQLRDLKPYYKEGKVRVAGDGRGVWGAELYDDPTTIIVQPTANIVKGMCDRDTFYFDDFSVVNHSGIAYQWEISPAPIYVENLNIRNPKVVFGNIGSFDVNLIITDANGVDHNKLMPNMITIEDRCQPDTLAGKAFKSFNNGDNMVVSEINLENITHFTVAGWWKPDSTLQAYAALFSSGDWCAHCDYTEGLIVDYWGSKLWYKWPGNSNNWGSNSGMTIPMNKWSYVALTIEPTKATLYLNEQKYVHNINLNPGNITNLYIAKGHYNKSFRGEIDEVTFWNRTLSYDEIKKLRHITKEDQIENDPDLIGYYQFNENLVGSQIMDKAGINHGVLSSGSTLVESSAPVGGGISEIFNVTSGGLISSPTTGLDIEFPSSGTYPNGDIVISRINNPPNTNPSKGTTVGSYWIVNNYGPNKTFSALNFMLFKTLDNLTPNATSGDYTLNRREKNEHLALWGEHGTGDVIDIGDQAIKYEQSLDVDKFGQFAIDNQTARGWIGVESTEWNNPLNWGQGELPTAMSDVIIPANVPFFPVVNIDDTIRSLTIMRNASFGVENGIEFEILD